LQGFGGGIAQPLGAAQLYRAFPPKEQGTAFGILGIALVVAPALGPILGGWLVDLHIWRAIFFVNVPIGIVGVAVGTRFLVDNKPGRRPLLDPLGILTAIVGFGAVLYAAAEAETYGWTGTQTLLILGLGLVVLLAHVFIELRVAKDPMTDLRLFSNPVFLNASLVGYVATIALFGAEFLMPIYLQSFRGRTALEAGVILLGVAATSAIATPLAGRLYDKIGPRMIMFTGFVILCFNTWQLAELQATTAIPYIVFLLALRGVAVGLILQTSYVAALGSIPVNELPRGSSLFNSTRFVVQAVSVAALATILVSFLSPTAQAAAQQMQEAQATNVRFGVCETPGVAIQDNLPPGTEASLASMPATLAEETKARIVSAMKATCDQTMQGFEAAYRLTFYAALGALLIVSFLPGWPGKWGGRGSTIPGPSGH
jgi:DHA2 family multidrug resistance protein